MMPNCFALEDNAKIWPRLRVLMNARAPHTDVESGDTYVYYPLTGVQTQNIANLNSSTWSGEKWHFIWGNRFNGGWNPRANIISPNITHPVTGRNCRVEYSSYAKADAADKVQIMYSCGYDPSEYESVAIAAGFSLGDIFPHSILASDPEIYFPYDSIAQIGDPPEPEFSVAHDIIYLQTDRIADVPGDAQGIMLDVEAQDDRTPEMWRDHMIEMASIVHNKGYKITTWGNPLTAGGSARTGFDVSVNNDILNAVDFLHLTLYSGVPEGDMVSSFWAQIETLKGPDGDLPVDFNKLILMIGLGGESFEGSPLPSVAMLTPSDARAIRSIIESYVHNIAIWRAFATQGGVCDLGVNRLLGILLLGKGMSRPGGVMPF